MTNLKNLTASRLFAAVDSTNIDDVIEGLVNDRPISFNGSQSAQTAPNNDPSVPNASNGAGNMATMTTAKPWATAFSDLFDEPLASTSTTGTPEIMTIPSIGESGNSTSLSGTGNDTISQAVDAPFVPAPVEETAPASVAGANSASTAGGAFLEANSVRSDPPSAQPAAANTLSSDNLGVMTTAKPWAATPAESFPVEADCQINGGNGTEIPAAPAAQTLGTENLGTLTSAKPWA